MSSVVFHPGRLHGVIEAPPSKSEAHRALILAALGAGPCRVEGLRGQLCDDTLATVSTARALGARVERDGDALTVTPGAGPNAEDGWAKCDARACAATLRMAVPALLATGRAARIRLAAGLRKRPMAEVEALLREIEAAYRFEDGADEEATLTLQGRLTAGAYRTSCVRTSQLASGLLMALPSATNARGEGGPSRLTVEGPIASRPYLDMTLRMMRTFGLTATEPEPGRFEIQARGGTKNPARVRVGGDWTQAAAFFCVNALGSGVMVKGLDENGARGERATLDALKAMGLRAWRAGDALCVGCPSRAALTAVTLDCSGMPDVAPLLALCCTQARGTSTLTGVKRLRGKECDRLDATMEALSRLGASAKLAPDGDTLWIRGGAEQKGPTGRPIGQSCGPTGPAFLGGFTMDARDDHRLVMLLAMAALRADAPITVTGAEALTKSWPGFLEDYNALGGRAEC